MVGFGFIVIADERRKKVNKKFYLICLGLSMFWSISSLVCVHFYYGVNSPQGLFLIMSMIIPGIIGLYCSTKVSNQKIRGILLFTNFLFFTYFNFMQLMEIIGYLLNFLQNK